MTQPPRILFVADAGPSVGGGHVMRCLTLAWALVERGGVCAFAATPTARSILDAYAGAEIERLWIEVETPDALAEAAVAAAGGWRADVVVADHYGLNAQHEAPLGAGRRLFVIDDLRRPHRADLVLDSNLIAKAADYPDAPALVGPAFALVRAEFAKVAAAAFASRAARAPSRLMISLGLTDVGGITGRVVDALRDRFAGMTFDVVLGAAAPSLDRLRALAGADPSVKLHVDSRRMAELMAEADLCIGAGGSSTWERCCLGLPTVTVVLADNQRANALALAELGGTVVLEAGAADFEARLVNEVGRLWADADWRATLARAGAALCDGHGAARVSERLLALL